MISTFLVDAFLIVEDSDSEIIQVLCGIPKYFESLWTLMSMSRRRANQIEILLGLILPELSSSCEAEAMVAGIIQLLIPLLGLENQVFFLNSTFADPFPIRNLWRRNMYWRLIPFESW